jgi:peptidylprolyl isomerase
MAQAKEGDTVRVHYTGRLDDGAEFDSSRGRDPLEFTIGEEEVISGFEQAVVGMNAGDEKTTTIAADDAYGPRDEKKVMVVDRDELPEDMPVKVNDRLRVRQPDGETFVVTVTDVSDATVTLDANHPLAGRDLTFDIQLVEIV